MLNLHVTTQEKGSFRCPPASSHFDPPRSCTFYRTVIIFTMCVSERERLFMFLKAFSLISIFKSKTIGLLTPSYMVILSATCSIQEVWGTKTQFPPPPYDQMLYRGVSRSTSFIKSSSQTFTLCRGQRQHNCAIAMMPLPRATILQLQTLCVFAVDDRRNATKLGRQLLCIHNFSPQNICADDDRFVWPVAQLFVDLAQFWSSVERKRGPLKRHGCLHIVSLSLYIYFHCIH